VLKSTGIPSAHSHKNVDAARCEVLELESGALKHSGERFIGTESRSNCVGSLLTHHVGNIDEVQGGLAGERFERLRDTPDAMVAMPADR